MMAARGRYRGHAMEFRPIVGWVYVDTGRPVSESPMRDCGHCGLSSTPEGHDGCLGTLPNVRNACCGHGVVDDAYVQLDSGERLGGQRALDLQDDLRCEPLDK